MFTRINLLLKHLTLKFMLIYFGSDHAAYDAKKELVDYLQAKGHDVTDLGCFSTESCDYPDYAREVGEKVLEHKKSMGVLLCGTGLGMSMAANRLEGIRAALVTSEKHAQMAREHNDANIIVFGARLTEMEEMKKYLDVFMSTEFDTTNERHLRRINKIDTI